MRSKANRNAAITMKMHAAALKNHSCLLRQAFVALDSRWGNLQEVLYHELSPCPPALSSGGSPNSCINSDLVLYFMESCTSSAISVQELDASDVLDLIVEYWHMQFLVQLFKACTLILGNQLILRRLTRTTSQKEYIPSEHNYGQRLMGL